MNATSRSFTLVLLLASIAPVVRAGSSNSLMDISADGKLLACSNRDSGTVTVVDLATREAKFEIPVGWHPEGVSFLGDSHRLAVAVYGDDRIRFLDGATGKILGDVAVFDEPYGLVSSPDGTRLWATLEYPGRVVEIDPESKTIVREETVGRFLRGIALSPDGRLLVTEYQTGIVKLIDAETLQVVEEWIGTPQDNLARQIVAHPTRPKAYLPHQRSLTTVAHGSGSIFPYVSVIDVDEPESAADRPRRKRVQMDSFRGVYVVANPWEVALNSDGTKLYVVFSGTDDMFVANVLEDNYRELEYASLLRTGSNPRAVRVAPDDRTFYVYNALDFTVDVFDAQSEKKTAEIRVTEWPGEEDVLLGKKLFYSARPPMSRLRWIACSSCHPDGDADGRTWQQPEGLRNTQPLFGLKFTHPIHWSADRDEVQDFEHTIRSPLMRGRGLVDGPINESLGEPNAGLSPELDALAAYTNSHTDFKLSPYAKGGLSEAAKRGKKLFHSEEVGCARCHSGPYLTDQKMHDVGTGADDPTEKLGPDYDTPTLLGIYRSAPYLHHGKAETLEEVLTKYNRADRHGRTSHLSSEQIADLVEYLKALPYEQPERPED
jgi:YVTN family beta-propeller protein